MNSLTSAAVNLARVDSVDFESKWLENGTTFLLDTPANIQSKIHDQALIGLIFKVYVMSDDISNALFTVRLSIRHCDAPARLPACH